MKKKYAYILCVAILTFIMACALTGCDVFTFLGGQDDKDLMKFYYSASGEKYVILGLKDTNTEEVFIPSNVFAIQKDAFKNNFKIKTVSIAEGLVTIGDGAFENCSNLSDINIPKSVVAIGSRAFVGCSKIATLEIGADLTVIGAQAFERCSALREISVPGSVARLEKGTFYSCTSLETVVLPSSITYIGVDAFANCYNLQTIQFQGSMEQWNSMTREDGWKNDYTSFKVVCVDGTIEASMVH